MDGYAIVLMTDSNEMLVLGTNGIWSDVDSVPEALVLKFITLVSAAEYITKHPNYFHDLKRVGIVPAVEL